MSPLRKKQKAKLSRNEKRYAINRVLILGSLVVATSFFFPGGKALEYNYELGDVTREEIVAEFNFPILKQEQQLENDLSEAIKTESFRFCEAPNPRRAKVLRDSDGPWLRGRQHLV